MPSILRYLVTVRRATVSPRPPRAATVAMSAMAPKAPDLFANLEARLVDLHPHARPRRHYRPAFADTGGFELCPGILDRDAPAY